MFSDAKSNSWPSLCHSTWMGGSPVKIEQVVIIDMPSVNVAGKRNGLMLGFPAQRNRERETLGYAGWYVNEKSRERQDSTQLSVESRERFLHFKFSSTSIYCLYDFFIPAPRIAHRDTMKVRQKWNEMKTCNSLSTWMWNSRECCSPLSLTALQT